MRSLTIDKTGTMVRGKGVLAALLLVAFATGCGGGDPCGGEIATCADGFAFNEATCKCRADSSSGTPVNCNSESDCPQGFGCVSLELAGEATQKICAEPTACGDLQCESGECVKEPDLEPADVLCVATCPLTQVQEGLVEEASLEALMDISAVAAYSHEGERGFSLSLTGVDAHYTGFLTLISECTAPASYDATCESVMEPPGEPVEPFWEAHDRCVRLRCEDAGIGLVDVYMTMKPHTAPDDVHPFTYGTTLPAGQATSDPNPIVTWRVDLRDPNAIIVSADLARSIVVTPTGGDPINLTQAGSATANLTSGAESTSVGLQFPGLVAAGTLSAQIDADSAFNIAGSVSLNGRVLATVSGGPQVQAAPSFAWQGACAL